MESASIRTILTALLNQVNETAQAAEDVLFEHDCFKVLSKYLFCIEAVLRELRLQKLNDSKSARQALEYLQTDVRKAYNLAEKYKSRARFYLLIRFRNIVLEVQDVTKDIGWSLAASSLADSDLVPSGILEQLNVPQNEMLSAKFEASQSQLQIVDKLEKGLGDQICDQRFANDMLSK